MLIEHEGRSPTVDPSAYVFGLGRPADGESLMPGIAERFGHALGRHRDDRQL